MGPAATLYALVDPNEPSSPPEVLYDLTVFAVTTQTVSDPSTATPVGLFTAQEFSQTPLDANFWIRSFTLSATYTLPTESIAMSSGFLNCPFPIPYAPQLPRKAPPLS